MKDKYIETRKDIIQLSILVMKSNVSVKVKEQFLVSMINPVISIAKPDIKTALIIRK